MATPAELSEIRTSRGWRASVWGIRLFLAGFIFGVVGFILLATGVSPGGGIAGAGVTIAVVGALVGAIGAVIMTPKTSRYSGVAGGGTPSIAQTTQLIRAVARDVFGASATRTTEQS